MSEWWLKEKYLINRKPIAIKGNAAAVPPKQPCDDRDTYVRYEVEKESF